MFLTFVSLPECLLTIRRARPLLVPSLCASCPVPIGRWCRAAPSDWQWQVKCKANAEPSSLELCWAAAFTRDASQMHCKGTKKSGRWQIFAPKTIIFEGYFSPIFANKSSWRVGQDNIRKRLIANPRLNLLFCYLLLCYFKRFQKIASKLSILTSRLENHHFR